MIVQPRGNLSIQLYPDDLYNLYTLNNSFLVHMHIKIAYTAILYQITVAIHTYSLSHPPYFVCVRENMCVATITYYSIPV